MASSSSVRLASIFPMSLRTSAGSVLWLRALDCWRVAGVGDGCGGRPARDGLGDENSACLPVPVAARVLIVPAFSLAKGSESDSVLELDWKKEGMIKKNLKMYRVGHFSKPRESVVKILRQNSYWHLVFLPRGINNVLCRN